MHLPSLDHGLAPTKAQSSCFSGAMKGQHFLWYFYNCTLLICSINMVHKFFPTDLLRFQGSIVLWVTVKVTNDFRVRVRKCKVVPTFLRLYKNGSRCFEVGCCRPLKRKKKCVYWLVISIAVPFKKCRKSQNELCNNVKIHTRLCMKQFFANVYIMK